MGIMEKISDVISQTEVKKMNLRKTLLTLLLEWKDLETHLELTQKCFQESYDELNSRENHLHAVQESVTQSSNDLETIRKSIEKRFQEVERKEIEFQLFQTNRKREMEFMEEKLGLIRKDVKMREERLDGQEKSIERHLKEVEIERRRFEDMRKLVDKGVEEMSLKQKCIEDSVGNHESITKGIAKREKEIEMKEKKLKEMEQELELREKHLNSILNTRSQRVDASEELVEHTRKVSEASGSNQRRLPTCRNEAMPKVDASKPRKSGEQITGGRKRRRKSMLEFSESSENSSDHIEKTLNQKGSSYPKGEERSRKQVVESSETSDSSSSDETTGPVNIEIDDNSESIYECPAPEFNDFDKDKEESCFSVDQIWACYDNVDGMPRFYAQIQKVFKPGFKLHITWLIDDPKDQAGLDWVNNKLPFGCGRFRRGQNVEISNRFSFSQRMECGKSKSRASFVIHPRKGEVWALFHDWDIKWSSDTVKRQNFKFEIVEIVSDFVEDVGITVAYLEKVEGFLSLFQRSNPSEMNSLLIPSNELLRFSHRIPSLTMSGMEVPKGNKSVPEGSFELDPASLPINPGDICYPQREGSQRTDAGNGGQSRSNVNVTNSRQYTRGLKI